MAQVKKDEIKQAIMDAAINTFFQNGYLNTKMNHIAEKANISVGNIYRYFSNKDDLFYTVLPKSLVDSIKEFNLNKLISIGEAVFDSSKKKDNFNPDESRMEYEIAYRKELLILFRNCEGTIYEDFKSDLLNTITQSLKTYIQKVNDSYNKNIKLNIDILKIILNNMLNMQLDALEPDISMEERISMLKDINKYCIYGLKQLAAQYF